MKRGEKPVCRACGHLGHREDKSDPTQCSRSWRAVVLAVTKDLKYEAAAIDFGISRQTVSDTARRAGIRRYRHKGMAATAPRVKRGA